ALQDSRLVAEEQRARREFFGPSAVAPSAGAEQRFQEWFLLERESDSVGGVLCEVLQLGDAEGALCGSIASAFAIERGGGGVAEARDLQDGEVHELSAPRGALRRGDLLVGRIYSRPGGGFEPSVVAAAFRPGGRLAAAFDRDLQRLGLARRLSQLELEHL